MSHIQPVEQDITDLATGRSPGRGGTTSWSRESMLEKVPTAIPWPEGLGSRGDGYRQSRNLAVRLDPDMNCSTGKRGVFEIPGPPEDDPGPPSRARPRRILLPEYRAEDPRAGADGARPSRGIADGQRADDVPQGREDLGDDSSKGGRPRAAPGQRAGAPASRPVLRGPADGIEFIQE
jgi:hypothetical protein